MEILSEGLKPGAPVRHPIEWSEEGRAMDKLIVETGFPEIARNHAEMEANRRALPKPPWYAKERPR